MPRVIGAASLILIYVLVGFPQSGERLKLSAAQWQEDLQVALDTFLQRDRSFTTETRSQFRSAISHLQDTIANKSDDQIIVELAEAVALARNAHTRLYILRNRSELRRYPIRVWWFADGLYVIRATPEYSGLLGVKISRIGGRPVEQVKKLVDPLFAGNTSWLTYMSAYSMTSPDVLIGLGLIDSSGRVEVGFTDSHGRRGKRVLEPLPLRRLDQPTESWWDLSPARPRDDGAWMSALKVPSNLLPLYLQQTERQYWAKYLPQNKLFYIQFNRAGEATGGQPFAEFAQQVLNELQSATVKKIVVDMRFNTGGNLDVAKSFMERLAAFANERKIKVFVITGRATFSAGLFHAMQLRQYANSTLVGEPVGDDLDFWAEGGNVVLPNSKLSLHYGDRFHSYSPVERKEFKQYLIVNTDLSVSDPRPDLPVNITSREYFAGRDPALEAVMAYGARRQTKRDAALNRLSSSTH